MKQHIVHNWVWFPIFLIGSATLSLGFIWIWHPEPWLLDQLPNETLIQTTFENLFSSEINKYLPGYLKVIYRFFGLWLITIGLLILSYVSVTKLGTKKARCSIQTTLFITLIVLYYLMYNYLYASPLFPLLHGLALLLGCSVYFSTQIKE